MRPINRIKHVVDNSATLGANVVLPITIATATDTPVLGNAPGVETGSKVNGIYLRVEVASNEVADVGAIPNVYMFVAKNPGNNVTLPAPNAVGINDNKRFIIHQEMSMIENTGRGGNPRTLFNGVVVIPKGMRRFGPADILTLNIIAPALDIAVCMQAHYKEFR